MSDQPTNNLAEYLAKLIVTYTAPARYHSFIQSDPELRCRYCGKPYSETTPGEACVDQ